MQPQIITVTQKPDLVHGAVKASTGDAAGKPFVGISEPIEQPAGIAVTKPSMPANMVAAAKPSADNDILSDPEKFMPDARRLKIKGLSTGTGTTTMVKPTVATSSAPTVSVTGLPPGAGSIVAARNGLDGPVVYVPVQPVVVPKPWRNPLPPDPKVPEAPQLNTFVNAFTPPEPRGGNAQGPMMPMPPMGFGPGMGMPTGMPMMPPYGMNPYMMPQAMPYGYPRTAMDAQRFYNGPLPPDPFRTSTPAIQPVGYMQPIQPVAYMQPMVYPQYPSVPPSGVVTASAEVPAPAPTAPAAQIGQLLELLHNSGYPAQRELAANYLASCDWRANPQIVTALIEGAMQDPAPTVRAGCIADMMRMGVSSDAYRRMLEEMRTDADPRVRDAAEAAVARLGRTPTARAN
jgi:hypothetical protein